MQVDGVRTWAVVKTTLIVLLTLTAVGWGCAALMLGGFGKAIEQQSTVVDLREAIKLPTKNARDTSDSRQQRQIEYRKQTKQGQKLHRACQDWTNARKQHDLPSTRQGQQKACWEYEAYINDY